MFRKVFHIVFAIFLILATTGITLSMHYCDGKLVSASINKEAKSCCDGSGGCCQNKSFHFEVKDNYVGPVILENSKIIELDRLFSILFVSDIELLPEVEKTFQAFNDSSPPTANQKRLSLLQTYLC